MAQNDKINEMAKVTAAALCDLKENLVQSDWDQADNTKPDYIKNKPTIPSGGGMDIIESTANWMNIDINGVQYNTKADAVVASGLTEEVFDAILSGEKKTSFFRFSFEDNGTIIEKLFSPTEYASYEGDARQIWISSFPGEMFELGVLYIGYENGTYWLRGFSNT